ncbi:MAG: 50S ribosomal protein L13 [Candidatus Komeilibacteria bacterium]|nr:50S ribosomal protein L13 [Candidatus Komeilibacteria bacterium]
MSEHVFDAKNKIAGRLASQVAKLLIGKDQVSFESNKVAAVKAKVINITELKFTGKKMDQKKYYRHSGYLGNLRTSNLKTVWQKDPKKVFQQIVSGMLPKNKLRSLRLKNLIIE